METCLQQVRGLFEQAPGFMTIVSGPDHRYALVNRAYEAFLGRGELVGRPVREAAPELAAQGLADLCDHVYATGEPYVGRGQRVEIARSPGEPPVETWIDFVMQPVRDEAGRVCGIFCQGHEAPRPAVADAPDPACAEMAAALKTLTPRQTQVLEKLVAGKSNKVIARDLEISVRTVEAYRAQVMERTHAGSLSELVRMSVLARLHTGA